MGKRLVFVQQDVMKCNAVLRFQMFEQVAIPWDLKA